MTTGIGTGFGTRRLVDQPSWRALTEHLRRPGDLHPREPFARDPAGGERLTVEAAGIGRDDSNNRIPNEAVHNAAMSSPVRSSRCSWE